MLSRTCYTIPLLLLTVLPLSTQAQRLATSGQFSVGANGSAQFTVPIQVPAGTAGMQPKIALNYSSQASNGWMGTGWSLSGLSAITRCKKTLAQDGVRDTLKYTSDDSYCLDGQRLVPVSGVNGADGTEYRTEQDSFSKITISGSSAAYSGPLAFTVLTKSGLKMEYGTTDDAKVMPPQGSQSSGGIRAWALKKVTDRTGNYMMMSYSNASYANAGLATPIDDGVFYPTRIDYTGNAVAGVAPSQSVRFEWNSRTEKLVQYQAGLPAPFTNVDRRLGRIALYSGTTKIRSYNINYDETKVPSTVTSIEDCNDGIGAVCLPPIKFGYEADLAQFQFWSSDSAFPGTQTDYQQYFVDLNGDGRKSWIQISQAADDAWIGTAKTDGTFTTDRWAKLTQPVGTLNLYNHYFVDVNGDGKADWVRISRSTNEMWVALGSGNGNFQFWTKYLTSIGSGNSNKFYFADINGDGRADLIQIGNTNDTMSTALSTGDGNFQFWASTFTIPKLSQYDHAFADINGDGKADWLPSYSTALFTTGATTNYQVAKGYISRGDGTFIEPTYLMGTDTGGYKVKEGSKFYFADLNGDRLADMIAIHADGSKVYGLSKGDARTGPLVTVPANGYQYIVWDDIGAAGLTSLVSFDKNSLVGSLSLATGGDPVTFPSVAVSPSLAARNTIGDIPPAGYSYFLADVNGDGKADLIVINKSTRKAMVALSQFGTRSKMTSFAIDAATPTQISYKPFWDTSVNTPDSNAVYPLRNTTYPLVGNQAAPFMVSKVSTPTGIGGTLNTGYTYGGLRIDLARQQPQGFRWMTATQQESGISTNTTYLQDFPFTGSPAQASKNIVAGGNNGLLSQTTYTYGCTDFVQASACAVGTGKRYNVFTSQTANASWDLNGAVMPANTISYQYDTFNNPTQVINTTTGGYSTTTVTTYTNDTTKWWIGLPVRSTVTKVTP